MKKGRIAWKIIAMLLVVAAGFSLTRIVTMLFSENRIEEVNETIDDNAVLYNGQRGEVFIENSYSADNIGLEYVINGGAFLETFQDNSNREVTLLFENIERNDIVYRIGTDLYSRPDVYSHKQEQFHLNKDYRYGFFTAFSPAVMKDGVYEVYIEVDENEQDQGTFYTGMAYEKAGKIFKELEDFSLLSGVVNLFGEEVDDARAYATGISVNHELNFAWSSGWKTNIKLSTCGYDQDMICRINVISIIKAPQQVKVSCGDKLLYDEAISDTGEISFEIPGDCISADAVTLNFEYSNALIPKESGISEDPRRLAIAFNSIELELVK